MQVASSADDEHAPFMKQPFCVYKGHSADLLDVSWSKVLLHVQQFCASVTIMKFCCSFYVVVYTYCVLLSFFNVTFFSTAPNTIFYANMVSSTAHLFVIHYGEVSLRCIVQCMY